MFLADRGTGPDGETLEVPSAVCLVPHLYLSRVYKYYRIMQYSSSVTPVRHLPSQHHPQQMQGQRVVYQQ